MSDLLTKKEIRTLFDAALIAAGGVRPLARLTGLSPTLISRVQNGALPVSGRLATFLGLEKVSGYRRASRPPTRQTKFNDVSNTEF